MHTGGYEPVLSLLPRISRHERVQLCAAKHQRFCQQRCLVRASSEGRLAGQELLEDASLVAGQQTPSQCQQVAGYLYLRFCNRTVLQDCNAGTEWNVPCVPRVIDNHPKAHRDHEGWSICISIHLKIQKQKQTNKQQQNGNKRKSQNSMATVERRAVCTTQGLLTVTID